MAKHQERMVISGAGVSRAFFKEVFELYGAANPNILYDLSPSTTEAAFMRNSSRIPALLVELMGAKVTMLQADFAVPPSPSEAQEKVAAADILYVGGGSTRRVRRQWHTLGIVNNIKERVAEGSLVASGASAGAMVWFDRGYSDSRQYEVAPGNRWNYILVPGVGTVPAWATAHYTDTDDFCRQRDKGFKRTLQRHDGEWDTAVGLERFAALICHEGIAKTIDIRGEKATDPPHTVHIFEPGSTTPIVLGPSETFNPFH